MAKALIPILDIADDACDFAGDTLRKHKRYLAKQAARAYKDINMFVNSEVCIQRSEHPVSSVIEMNKDFVYETKVALKYKNKVIYLGRNMELEVTDRNDPHPFNQTQCQKYFENPDTDTSLPMYDNRGNIILAYGPGVCSEGLYRVDAKNGRILLGSNVPKDATILVEYVTDGISSGITVVPTETYDTIYHYCLWQYFLKRGDSRYREFERYYDESRFMLDTHYNELPINYIVSLFRDTEYGTINTHL